MAHDELIYEIEAKAQQAATRYGPYASTHEALGVCSEEWDELRDAIRANKLGSVEMECIDLAAALVRLARACRNGGEFAARSVK
jgi:NTP pyrophosphatase (non-canonical NTP hydrolase)